MMALQQKSARLHSGRGLLAPWISAGLVFVAVSGSMACSATTTDDDVGSESSEANAAKQPKARSKAKSIAGGSGHTCALLDGGRVKCWGKGTELGLGLGLGNNRGGDSSQMGAALPEVDLGSGRRAVQIAAGGSHTCALLDDDSVKCWGGNLFGELGLGDGESRGRKPGQMGDALPALDLGGGKVVELVAGAAHSCARFADGSVKCWGDNRLGELGLGDTKGRGRGPGEMGDALAKVDLGRGRRAVELAAADSHTCARLDDGSVKCWGVNAVGQLGFDGWHSGDEPGEMGDALPTVNLGRSAVGLCAGGAASCAILDDGSFKCWGDGDALGFRTKGRGHVGTVDVGANRKVVDCGIGFSHACAQLDDGSVKCWGTSRSGELGLGDTTPRRIVDAKLPAVDLGAGRTVVDLDVGQNHSCARLDDKSIKCWGFNGIGQLGIGDTETRGDQPGEMGDALPAVRLE